SDSSLDPRAAFFDSRSSQPSMRRHALTGLALAIVLVAVIGASRVAEPASLAARGNTEVVVSLDAPPLAEAGAAGAARLRPQPRPLRPAVAPTPPGGHRRRRD